MPPTRVRYRMLWLTVPVCMIMYMDRGAIGPAIPLIRRDLGIGLVGMGVAAAVYNLGYTLFQIPGGCLGDRIGPRRALTLFMVWWSVFASATAFALGTASL